MTLIRRKVSRFIFRLDISNLIFLLKYKFFLQLIENVGTHLPVSLITHLLSNESAMLKLRFSQNKKVSKI